MHRRSLDRFALGIADRSPHGDALDQGRSELGRDRVLLGRASPTHGHGNVSPGPHRQNHPAGLVLRSSHSNFSVRPRLVSLLDLGQHPDPDRSAGNGPALVVHDPNQHLPPGRTRLDLAFRRTGVVLIGARLLAALFSKRAFELRQRDLDPCLPFCGVDQSLRVHRVSRILVSLPDFDFHTCVRNGFFEACCGTRRVALGQSQLCFRNR